MASLDLNPDINLMLVQAAVFATNLYVVKRFLVEPHLELKEAREKETKGVKAKAEAFMKKGSALESEINTRLQEAHSEAAKIRARVQEEAEKEYSALVSSAREASEKELGTVTTQIAQAVVAEKGRITQESQKLIPSVVSALLGSKGKTSAS